MGKNIIVLNESDKANTANMSGFLLKRSKSVSSVRSRYNCDPKIIDKFVKKHSCCSTDKNRKDEGKFIRIKTKTNNTQTDLSKSTNITRNKSSSSKMDCTGNSEVYITDKDKPKNL